MNVAMHLMIQEESDDDRRRTLVDELTGPLRTMGRRVAPEDVNAPAWWHGDEDAYETSMAAIATLPQRRRR